MFVHMRFLNTVSIESCWDLECSIKYLLNRIASDKDQ